MRLNRRRVLQTLAGASAASLATRGTAAGQPLARPTLEQAAWQDMELEMFLCLDPCTWQGREYDNHSTPLNQIHPRKLDTDQWVDVAVSMGARQVLFVAKHTGGFCWWQTLTSNYGVKEIPWRSGKGDVVGDLSASCRRRGIKLGIYLSPQDAAHGAGIGGKCRSAEAQSSYDTVYRQQLTELLNRYGPVSEVWFDGSSTIDVGDILKRHAPRAMIFQSPYATIRWVGNEDGIAPYPAWNAVPEPAARSGIATAKDGNPEGGVWLPIECDARIRDTWFWNARNQDTLKSVDELLQMYYRSVGHGAVLLVNNTPDTTGLIPAPDVRRSAEFGAEIERRFGQCVAQTKGHGPHLELVLPGPTIIDHVITMEDIVGGERVRKYRVEALVGKGWREICRGTAIGHKKIDSFPQVTVSRLRFQVEQSAAEPLMRRFAAFHAGNSPSASRQSFAHAYQVLKDWGPRDLISGTAVWDLDLTAFCKDAGEYEIDFVSTGGRNIPGPRVLTLRHGDTDASQFVKPAGKRTYRLTVTGLGALLRLRVALTMPDGTDSYGQVVIRRMGEREYRGIRPMTTRTRAFVSGILTEMRMWEIDSGREHNYETQRFQPHDAPGATGLAARCIPPL